MRYYQQKYPEVDELVMVQVRQIAEMGAYVKLLEYDGTEGMILLSELSRRRIRSVQKLIRVGRNEVVVVLRVDKEKGYIDLSKRRVSPEDITRCEERYMKSKSVASILRHVASKLGGEVPGEKEKRVRKKGGDFDDAPLEEAPAPVAGEEERLEMLYETIAWPLGRTYGHPYDAFKLALTEPDTVFATLSTPIPEATHVLLTSTIARRLTPQPIKLRADIELTCYTPAGIDAIKRALRAGEKASTETVPIKAKLVAPPLYVLSTNATDKYAAVERLERAIEGIQASIEDEGGNCIIKMKPKTVSDLDDADLAERMRKADQENAEVEGDEDDEDEV
ncbi:eukaryotic translation initiation factor 2 subunit alpha [Mycena maculata]|uniref:Eukaryotic translation initiation factor 2 subunit alpha n=1 Tax=Mycena maculata TaxID=230809 RepID=A0AAD7MGT6_9AGAR|nr:eukaryotic translation initiation factor 2 subunit alpha [Mycena maculata]